MVRARVIQVYKCPICFGFSRTYLNCLDHIITAHKKHFEEPEKTVQKVYECEKCYKTHGLEKEARECEAKHPDLVRLQTEHLKKLKPLTDAGRKRGQKNLKWLKKDVIGRGTRNEY